MSKYEEALLRCPRGHKTFTTVERTASGEIKIDDDLALCSECNAEMKHIPFEQITLPSDIIQITDNALESANHHSLSAADLWERIMNEVRGLDRLHRLAVARGIHAYFTNL
jgi:hypothetical protein